ncbi:hypothetical protein BGW39_003891 [Mortierella sp. 14UC]|nr:hypothetical protein BGW39_003891 [Mortierella sp. 14UC]
MENIINNNTELTITTDMDLDNPMPLMSPNMPLTTIPEFEEEEEDDICLESTLQTFSQARKRSIVMITRTEEVVESPSYSSSSSAMSSPGGAISPSLNPFQWTSDLRQYIMTDIGPQPSNSQVPALRSHLHLVRQRSYSKIGGTGFGGAGLGGGLLSPSSNGGMSPLSPSSSMAKGFGMSMSSSPTMVRRASLQTQALVGQYGNGNAVMLMTNGNTGSSNTSSSNGSSLYGGVSTRGGDVSLYQQRAGSSSMSDLATIPHDKAFERDLMMLHRQHQQYSTATWDP